MATLILYDHASTQEISRREAHEDERYLLYEACQSHGLFGISGRRYLVKAVAYNPTTAQITVHGTFDSYEPGVSDCE